MLGLVDGAGWLAVPGVALLVLGWVLLVRADSGVRRNRPNAMFVALAGFVAVFTGLMVSMLGVRALDDQGDCPDGEAAGAGGYCSDFRGGD